VDKRYGEPPPWSVIRNGAIPPLDNRAARSLVTSFEVTCEPKHCALGVRTRIDLHQRVANSPTAKVLNNANPPLPAALVIGPATFGRWGRD
jgi:hypothetical protein